MCQTVRRTPPLLSPSLGSWASLPTPESRAAELPPARPRLRREPRLRLRLLGRAAPSSLHLRCGEVRPPHRLIPPRLPLRLCLSLCPPSVPIGMRACLGLCAVKKLRSVARVPLLAERDFVAPASSARSEASRRGIARLAVRLCRGWGFGVGALQLQLQLRFLQPKANRVRIDSER